MKKQDLQQITAWHEAEEHYMIVDFLSKKGELDTDEKLLLARAYNNLDKYEQSIELLNSIREEADEIAKWHYYMGYALFHQDDEHHIEAASYLAKAYELDPENYDAKILMAQANKLEPMNERVQRFWQWFLNNEAILEKIAKSEANLDRNETIEFINEGTALISPNVYFNIGGDKEFTFCVEGCLYQFYLYPYIIEQAPAELKSRWQFFAQKEELKGGSFSFGMYGVQADIKSIKVRAIYNEDENNFDIEYYIPNAETLEEKELNHLFYTVLELVTGEGMSYNYISGIKSVELCDEMIALSDLPSLIREKLAELEKECYTNPAKLYTVYRGNIDEEDEEEEFVPRSDIFTGNSSFMELNADYHRGEDYLYCGINSFGADAAFLCFFLPDELEPQQVLDLRYELEDKISATLERQGSGYVFGSAMSRDVIYIDLMLFNFRDFLTDNFNDKEDIIEHIFPDLYRENEATKSILDECSIFYSSFDKGVPMAQLYPDPDEEYNEDGKVHPELQGALNEVSAEMFAGMDMNTILGNYDVEAMQNMAQQMLGQVDLEALTKEALAKEELSDKDLENAYNEVARKMMANLNKDTE